MMSSLAQPTGNPAFYVACGFTHHLSSQTDSFSPDEACPRVGGE